MHKKIGCRVGVRVAVLALGLGLPATAMANDAADFVAALHDKVVAVFQDDLDSDARRAVFEEMVSDNLAVDALMPAVAGSVWRKADRAKKAALSRALSDFITTSFAKILEESFIQEYEIVAVESTPGGKVVVSAKTTSPYSLFSTTHAWTVVNGDDGAYRIYDVAEAGFSFLETYEDELKQALASSGVDGVIAELKEADTAAREANAIAPAAGPSSDELEADNKARIEMSNQ